MIIGHRGASGHALENGWAAFRLAADPGAFRCHGVELDIHSTADGIPVVHHDEVIHTGEAIAELSAAELSTRPLRDGTPVPTLEEVLAAFPGLELFIEAKALPPAADETLLRLIAGAPAPARCHVHAFDHRIIARLHERAPALSLGVLSTSWPVDPVGPVLAAGAGTLWMEWSLIDRELVSRCHAEGIAVIAWTVNGVAEAKRLTALGVDGLCGNWPERLRG